MIKEDFFTTVANALGLSTDEQQASEFDAEAVYFTMDRSGDVERALEALMPRGWNPQAVDTLLSLRAQLEDLIEEPTLTGLLGGMIAEIDVALVGWHKSVDSTSLHLEQGQFVWNKDTMESGWTPRGEGIFLPNTQGSLLAISLIMQISLEDLRHSLEDEGECSTSEWMVGYGEPVSQEQNNAVEP